MTKTIENIDLLKKLNDGGYLDGIETEYYYNTYHNSQLNSYWEVIEDAPYGKYKDPIKTLTLEEAIELLPEELDTTFGAGKLTMGKRDIQYYEVDCLGNETNLGFNEGETLLQAIEKMLEYLLDNDLLHGTTI